MTLHGIPIPHSTRVSLIMKSSNNNNDNKQNQQVTFPPSLVRKLILFHNQAVTENSRKETKRKTPAPPRISNDGVLAAGELLRLLVIEARNRASLLAECEQEASIAVSDREHTPISIRSDHITQIAAELLMDFS